MNPPARNATGAMALAVLGLVLAGIAAWLAFGLEHATLEYLRRDLPFGWLLALGMPAAAASIGGLAAIAWLGACWLQCRARRA